MLVHFRAVNSPHCSSDINTQSLSPLSAEPARPLTSLFFLVGFFFFFFVLLVVIWGFWCFGFFFIGGGGLLLGFYSVKQERALLCTQAVRSGIVGWYGHSKAGHPSVCLPFCPCH